MRCPGQDMRYWKYDSIFEVKCPHCGEKVEFFKDEASRKCPNCKKKSCKSKNGFWLCSILPIC